MLYESLQVVKGYGASAACAGIFMEVDVYGGRGIVVVEEDAQQVESLVIDHHAYAVSGWRCENSVLRNIDVAHSNFYLMLVGLVEREHQPEYSCESEEGNKNQKFPVRFAEQEMSDGAEKINKAKIHSSQCTVQLFLHGCAGHIFEHVTLVDGDDHIACNLYIDGILGQVDAFYSAIDAAASNHLSTFLQFVLELLDFLALLLLRADHKEIHDGKNSAKHDECHHHAVAAIGSCCL